MIYNIKKGDVKEEIEGMKDRKYISFDNIKEWLMVN